MWKGRRPKIVVIAGPTASGKSGFAVDLARSLSAEIVNADSMQVYRGMDIGTAKPTLEEQRGVPHHLLDVVNPDEPFNAAIYRRKALSSIDDICSRKKACLVVGGTGLYIRALVGGLMKAPPSDSGLRKALHKECDAYGSVRLHERLKGLDPRSAAAVRIRRVRRPRRIVCFSPCLRRRYQSDFHDSGLQCFYIVSCGRPSLSGVRL